MTDRDSRLAVRVAVTFAVVAGASCSGFIVATTWRRGIGDPRIFALGFAALALVNIFPIIFEWKGHAEHVSVDETLYATLVMVAPPIVPLLAMVFGSVVGNVYHRRPLIKVAFNIGIIGLSTSAALGVSRLVTGQLPVGTAWRGLLGAAAGALACYATTTLAVRVMVAIADQVPVHRQFSRTSLLEVMLVSTTVSMGLLGGLASGTQALSLLFVLPPLAIIGVVLHQHARAVRDRHKLDRLLETAVVVNRASGPYAVRAVLLDAACSLLHTDNSRMQADPPEDHELGSRVVTDSNELWLVASPRTRNQTFTGEDQSVLDGVAAIASSSLGSAELLERVRHQAFHDSLTGLPNRLLFEDRVQQALRVAAGREGAMVAVLFIDLDRFKRVNDSLGHHTGDTLLQDVAERLQSALRVCDSAARVGGDEFVVLVPELGSEEAALEIAERLISVMRIPYRVGHREIVVTASVGVAISPRDGRDHASLLCIADLAMYEAKAAGRNVVRCLSAGTSAEGPTAEGQFALEVDLRRAMQHDELWVAYQPQIDIATRRMVGVEALVRWTHPTRGLITPDEFLPLAEELGMIGAIDEWVLASACREAAAWRALGGTDLRVSVNLSERNLQSGRIYTLVTDVLAETGLPANRLELEVTEKVVATQGATGDEALARLRQHGVRVAIDDFGTGYSSLSRLGSLPVDIVKIDQSFMAEVIDLTTPVPLVSSAIAMGHGLGLEVIAEGVETTEQLEFLSNEGCDLVQGFLLGRPMTAAELRSRLLFDATVAAREAIVSAR